MRVAAFKIVLTIYLLIALSYCYDELTKPDPVLEPPIYIEKVEEPKPKPEIKYKRIVPNNLNTSYNYDTVADFLEEYRDDFEFYYN